ncbi:YdeI/OmpD-associated family protein [Glaciibacter superstes]|uniref:YdeI/OmpD-associated family protein n=1 Tax=Glaciibacter superstes TaxID=501023 RepID=UPI0003B415FF|nr:YdeI/OmpD-associated family protein [Glaciibacter superstes]
MPADTTPVAPEPTWFDTADAFRAWLLENDESSTGLWVAVAKKDSGLMTVTYAEAVDAALEHGWIDGQSRRIDEKAFMQRFTPRRPQSPWSVRNCSIVEAKIAEGRMAPKGLAEVERAKADGRWERAYEGPKNAEPHPDFLEALAKNPAASEFYTTLSSQNRYAIYYRVQEAKREETRARRIEKFVGMLERGETVHG